MKKERLYKIAASGNADICIKQRRYLRHATQISVILGTELGIKKAHLHRRAIFVNLKSNTMKNTLQRYGLLGLLQILELKQLAL